MADEDAGGGSTKLVLLVAIVLGVIVVLLYNIQIARIRKASKPKSVLVLSFKRDMDAGENIDAGKDIGFAPVPESLVGRLSGIIEEDALVEVEKKGMLNQNVKKGQLVFWHHVTQGGRHSPAGKINKGMVAIGVQVDSQRVVGDPLRVGDRVNLLGFFPVGEAEAYKACRIIEGILVHSIGGRGLKRGTGDRAGSVGRSGLSSYRMISVEVKKDVSLQLSNVLTRAQGGRIWYELRNPAEELRGTGMISPALSKLAEKAVPDPSSGGGSQLPM